MHFSRTNLRPCKMWYNWPGQQAQYLHLGHHDVPQSRDRRHTPRCVVVMDVTPVSAGLFDLPPVRQGIYGESLVDAP